LLLMKREDDEKLWDLLGRSAEPEISPFFARNVLRKIRTARGEESPRSWWRPQWLVPLTGVAVVLAALTFPSHPFQRPQPQSAEVVTLGDSQDSDLLADLDELVSSDETLALDDSVLL